MVPFSTTGFWCLECNAPTLHAAGKWLLLNESFPVKFIIRCFLMLGTKPGHEFLLFPNLQTSPELFSNVWDVSLTLIVSIENLQRSLTQLVSTSNKRSSLGEMKKRPEEGDIYRGKNLTPILDQRVWTVKVIFTPFQSVQWSLISVTWSGELLQSSSNTCGCVCHTLGEMKEWHYSIHVRC